MKPEFEISYKIGGEEEVQKELTILPATDGIYMRIKEYYYDTLDDSAGIHLTKTQIEDLVNYLNKFLQKVGK